jgi:hypothetical protein
MVAGRKQPEGAVHIVDPGFALAAAHQHRSTLIAE